MLRVVRTAFMLSTVLGAGLLVAVPASASVTERFIGHAHYESKYGHANVPSDPEIFVADENAPAATGALGIAHAAGYRAALLADRQGVPIFNSQGDGLSLSLGRWLDGGGTAEFMASDEGDGSRVNFTFTGLVPFGLYSLFLSHSTPDGTLVTPFGEGTAELTPTIDGFLQCSAVSTAPLETGDKILLVYHSDGAAHGQSRGDLGISAHDQLILPVVIADRGQPADSTAVPVPDDGPPPAPVQQPAEPTSDASPPPAAQDNTGDVYMPSTRAAPPVENHATESVTSDGEPTF